MRLTKDKILWKVNMKVDRYTWFVFLNQKRSEKERFY